MDPNSGRLRLCMACVLQHYEAGNRGKILIAGKIRKMFVLQHNDTKAEEEDTKPLFYQL